MTADEMITVYMYQGTDLNKGIFIITNCKIGRKSRIKLERKILVTEAYIKCFGKWQIWHLVRFS